MWVRAPSGPTLVYRESWYDFRPPSSSARALQCCHSILQYIVVPGRAAPRRESKTSLVVPSPQHGAEKWIVQIKDHSLPLNLQTGDCSIFHRPLQLPHLELRRSGELKLSEVAISCRAWKRKNDLQMARNGPQRVSIVQYSDDATGFV
jgi:hypothetical protein